MLAVAIIIPLAFMARSGWANGIEGKTTVDPDTTNSWQNFTAPGGVTSTQNVGRIWTDKSVFDKDYALSGSDALNGKSVSKGDSDFLVGLSALSSTSNLKEMVQTGKPLDIVLVLDDSGSMEYLMPVYDDGTLDKSQTYHTEDGSGFFGSTGNEVVWNENRQEWGYYSRSWGGQQWNSVTPTASADDNSWGHTQLYGQSRTEALQTAVNNFIDQTAAASGQITNENNKHRLSRRVWV